MDARPTTDGRTTQVQRFNRAGLTKQFHKPLRPKHGIQKGQLKDLYSPLEPGMIRLVDLRFSEPSQFTYSLREVPLGSEQYTAVSYTWIPEEYSWYGTKFPGSKKVIINGLLVLIPSRVALILWVLSKIGVQTLWIDRLSINQDDVAERGHQVACMNQIFGGASEVLIFLGRPNESTDQTFPRICASGAAPARYPDNGLLRLLDHRYWHRAWILQEIGLSRKLTIVCGEYVLDNIQSTALLRRLVSSERDNRFKPHLSMINKIASGSRPPLLDILIGTRHAECSEPRDAIYSKMHLARDGHMLGEPDYSETVGALFTRFAGTCIINSESLEILVFASGSRNEQDMPSWVADWTPRSKMQEMCLVSGFNSVLKESMRHCQASLAENGEVLVARGCIIDKMRPLKILRKADVANSSAPDTALGGEQDLNRKKESMFGDDIFLCLIFGCPSLLVLARDQDYYVVINVTYSDKTRDWAEKELFRLGHRPFSMADKPITEFKIR